MLRGLWGKKIGMTQVFADNNTVVPVTVIDTSSWLVTQVKTIDNDGYRAVQVGRVRKKYENQAFSPEWLKKPATYFYVLREVPLRDDAAVPTVGQAADSAQLLASGDAVDVIGSTIGRGFQGGVKRHGFAGGRASHGDKLGRKPGSLSFIRTQGLVIKGKRLPGHMGVEQVVMRNLRVVKVEPEANLVLVKGSIPGKAGSLVFLRKCGT